MSLTAKEARQLTNKSQARYEQIIDRTATQLLAVIESAANHGHSGIVFKLEHNVEMTGFWFAGTTEDYKEIKMLIEQQHYVVTVLDNQQGLLISW